MFKLSAHCSIPPLAKTWSPKKTCDPTSQKDACAICMLPLQKFNPKKFHNMKNLPLPSYKSPSFPLLLGETCETQQCVICKQTQKCKHCLPFYFYQTHFVANYEKHSRIIKKQFLLNAFA